MLNWCEHGAAFLVPTDVVPRLGERLTLSEMYSSSRLVREGATPLPQIARVVRVDPSDGPTSKVAARFEVPDSAEVATAPVRRGIRSLCAASVCAPIPPVALHATDNTAPQRAMTLT
jgi:hypothetical protein